MYCDKDASRNPPRGFFFSALYDTNAAESITHRICKPLQTRCEIAVGYLNKEGLLNNFNFVTPVFRTVGGSAVDVQIQDLQMDASVGLSAATFSILDNSNLRKAITDQTYTWVPKSQYKTCKIQGREGDNGAWALKVGTGRDAVYTIPTGADALIKAGSSVQINVNGTGKFIYINPTYTLAN